MHFEAGWSRHNKVLTLVREVKAMKAKEAAKAGSEGV